MPEKHEIIQEACLAISDGNTKRAKQVIKTNYPFTPPQPTKRKYLYRKSMQVFLKDGFIDRYSGDRLVFPPVLRILSSHMPEVFPYHPNWKTSECHMAYWQLYPTIDHVVPVTRGGTDEIRNIVCTSQLRNSAKSNWLITELGWEIQPAGNLNNWDGLISWFFVYVQNHETILQEKAIANWYRIAKSEYDVFFQSEN